MVKKSNVPVVSDFARKVLTCFKEQRLLAEEVQAIYDSMYPPSFLVRMVLNKKSQKFHVSIQGIQAALKELVREDFLHKEVTSFTDRALPEEVDIFWISPKGRSYLLPKK